MSNHHPRSENFIFKKELLLSSFGKQTIQESVCGPHAARAQDQAEILV